MTVTDDTAAHELVIRLARRSPGGGYVIERAAILAEGSHVHAVEAWILAHGGKGETTATPTGGGLFADRGATPPQGPPARYVLPAGALA